jgi:hypothetical protein
LLRKGQGEAGWDLGCFVVCLLAAGLARLGAPAWIWVALPLPATLASAHVLRRYFARPD